MRELKKHGGIFQEKLELSEFGEYLNFTPTLESYLYAESIRQTTISTVLYWSIIDNITFLHAIIGKSSVSYRTTGTISRCIICGQFFDSKKELKGHKDKSHRITNAKLAQKEPDHPSQYQISFIFATLQDDDGAGERV